MTRKSFSTLSNVINHDLWQSLCSLIHQKTLENKDMLIKQGEIADKIVWIKHGILRSYFLLENGEERTYCITFDGSMMTAMTSFISGQSSKENIQSIGKTELYILYKKDVDMLCKDSIVWTIFFKKLLEEQFIELEEKLFDIQRLQAKERYLKLLHHHPEYIQHIPGIYLASFLNISPRHLSRIRKEVVL
ncbi:Crp/Fnr family transcriptional regulator [Myroides sp. M-43]|uniref:Crp/Fnr family transcriptional regulator n=1 Tax=Myroides oncorhynchi TaxID=2893756 RepID=UPI001E46EA22|nr:Crp/Fnr family transcriptional regulator [Myroides oncorhynchi]MCC9043242.1 Crp/Fnr family transcriptional regulator [Myroides oncorhynchi]